MLKWIDTGLDVHLLFSGKREVARVERDDEGEMYRWKLMFPDTPTTLRIHRLSLSLSKTKARAEEAFAAWCDHAGLVLPASPVWKPTHRHRNGNHYRVIARGKMEADHTPVVVYDDAAGTVWIRPTTEFEDGRFDLVKSAIPFSDKGT